MGVAISVWYIAFCLEHSFLLFASFPITRREEGRDSIDALGAVWIQTVMSFGGSGIYSTEGVSRVGLRTNIREICSLSMEGLHP